MIKYAFSIILLFIFIINGNGQNYLYPENSHHNGLRLIESKPEGITLKFAINEFQIIETEIEDLNMSKIIWGSAFLPGEEGYPELPSISKYLIIPNDAEFEILIPSKSEERIQEIIITPAAKTPGELQATSNAKRGGQYSKDSFYPKSPIQHSITEIRGFKVIRLSIIPFQYNAVSKELIINKNLDIQIKISSQNHQFGEERFRSIYWDQIFSNIIFNDQDLPPIDYARDASKISNGCDLLILCPDKPEFLQWGDSLKRFRNEQGIHTKIITTSEIGGNEAETINSFFEEVYDSWDPVPSAILLLGDMLTQNNGIMSKKFTDYPQHNNIIISDNYYADVSNNELPDFDVLAEFPYGEFAQKTGSLRQFFPPIH